MNHKTKRKKEKQQAQPQSGIPLVSPGEPEDQSTAENGAQKRENRERKSMQPVKWWRQPQVIVEIGAIVVGLIVATIYFFQLRIMQRQFALTQESVHTGQRAYLIFHHAVLDATPSPDTEIVASIDLTNSGQTPAKDVIASVHLFPSPKCPPDGVSYPNGMKMMPIGAGQTNRPFSMTRLNSDQAREVTTEDVTFPAENQVTINTAHLYLCFIGIARYRDVFGNQGETRFCNVYNRKKFLGCLASDSNTIE